MQKLFLQLFVFTWIVMANSTTGAQPEWIWPAGNSTSTTKDLGIGIRSAKFTVVADFGEVDIRLNHSTIGVLHAYQQSKTFDLTPALQKQANRLLIKTKNLDGPSAFAGTLRIERADGSMRTFSTDESWSTARSYGPVDRRFWDFSGQLEAVDAFENYEQWREAKGVQQSTAASAFTLLPGFEIDLIRSAGKNEDSWISMDFDPQGRLIIAREKSGLIRLTLKNGKATKIEVINEDLPEIRGVLFAHGSLYVNSNSHNLRKNPRDRTGGLFRLRDTNGDGHFDEVTLLGERTATGGHGRNDITLGPDGKIYLIAGDSVATPKTFTDLTPRIPHFLPGDDLPQGHVIRTDKDGKEWELVCKGLRNPYGIHFNPDGEMFTFDADAEHDMGAPWYRPTHLRQLVEGADYGWRRVTGRWPPYYADHADQPPTTLRIGKSSPTAVKFGTKSNFPRQWQEALYILDWTYGRILAIHMTPRGAGYQGRTERFLQGKPANVTDLDFGPDGAMYFVTGGRGTQSGLYRVRFTGKRAPSSESTKQMQRRTRFGKNNRNLRRHVLLDSSLAQATLGHTDPWVRYAARTSVEKSARLDVAGSKSTATDEAAELTYLTAVSRLAAIPLLIPVPENLNRLDWNALNDEQRLELIRILEIYQLRKGEKPAIEISLNVLQKKLAGAYPTGHREVDLALCSVLAGMNSYGYVAKTLDLISTTENQKDLIHYLFHLRNQKTGWTDELRKRYFLAFRRTKDFRGGAGLPKFLKQIQTDAIASLPTTDRKAYQVLLEQPDQLKELLATVSQNRKFVREWNLTDFGDELVNHQPNLKRGKEMYTAASCILCHQLGTTGRVLGPDLTSVSARFSRRDLMESIINPSKVISEKYRSVTVTTQEGEEYTGRVVMAGDYRKAVLRISTNPLNPKAVVELGKSSIVKRRFSSVSSMPEGLLNSLTKPEILDLLAYIETGGK